ncbi:MAG: ATP-binding protein [Candidatus Symbiothrix sp.]|jgi:predicted AAA+ superfamily ATPase|nr:ATP-binding protein [Candidatus Symbiothrix sp.]
MLRQEEIAEVIDLQREVFLHKDVEVIREALPDVPIIDGYATIIKGIRRCGKSTLLLQLLNTQYKEAIYLNFEDIRLAGFDVSDFARFLNEIIKRGIKVIFLDEIQLIGQWEIFVNQLLREGYTVFITGSNALLLSKELGTHLTGRHVSIELFPFSYQEYLTFKNAPVTADSFNDYLTNGGIPEYVRNSKGIILNNLLNDILIRDIAVRHAVRDVESLRQLAVYLITNVGTLVSANKLVGMFGIKSSATILEFFSYFKDAYLMEFVPQFSYSIKAQVRNPKKIYAIDTGIVTEVSTAFTDNIGHKLENLIYIHLRRMGGDIFYYHEKRECDFVVFKKGKAVKAVQVCYQIDDLNFEREYNGLLDAMHAFQLKEGVIVSMNQSDEFNKEDCKVKIVPAFEFLT